MVLNEVYKAWVVYGCRTVIFTVDKVNIFNSMSKIADQLASTYVSVFV
jgi:hypothetical protein